ncbi:carbohydrate kinase family protein [Kineococcus glutinatus]|uniref:Sugar kinase n=1 Tax=Kineococcus glutinatus TaxID=1070872 RepID=A0ABP9I130_9ACTN
MPRTPRVLVVGPVAWNLLVHLDELPQPFPHTDFARRWAEALGGTSAGKALNLRRLGADVVLATLVGDDEAGGRVLARLHEAGVDVLPRRSSTGTERHANLLDPTGRRVSLYLTLAGAPSGGSGDDAAALAALDAAVAGADAVVVDLADHSRRTLRTARGLGRPVWCDLHDYDGRSAFHAEFLDAAENVFVSDDKLDDPEGFLRAQVAAGKRLVVCTQGARGAVALERGGDLVRVAAEPVAQVVSTDGAGDAFFAGFLVAHLGGAPLAECMRRGARSAAACVRSPELAGEAPAAG